MVLKAVLVFYNLAIASLLLFQGVQRLDTLGYQLLVAFLLPVVAYTAFLLIERIRSFPGLAALKGLAFVLSLITTSILFFFNLGGATTQAEYILAALSAPLPLYFWGSLVGRFVGSSGRPKEEAVKEEKPAPAKVKAVSKEGVEDPKRRDFLKKIGGVGLGILAYSILNPRGAGAAFFGSVPGPGTVAIKDTAGNQIDPAEKYPTSGYGITEIDDAGTTFYYGFVDKAGAWYIIKENDTTGDLSYLYATPANNPTETDFADAWADRATTLTYQQFDSAF
ncbi:hypothetical protein GTO10_02370 [Candidatus Saccharibacteria bacterium]|nr:hypothetical protein [Candidatus Saccharibacteria bacterium]